MAVAWASDGAEASGHRGGGTSPCQRGGPARPSLHGCVGGQVLQYLGGSSGSHWSYDPVMVPSLWVSTARADTVGLYGCSCISDAICMMLFEVY